MVMHVCLSTNSRVLSVSHRTAS